MSSERSCRNRETHMNTVSSCRNRETHMYTLREAAETGKHT